MESKQIQSSGILFAERRHVNDKRAARNANNNKAIVEQLSTLAMTSQIGKPLHKYGLHSPPLGDSRSWNHGTATANANRSFFKSMQRLANGPNENHPQMNSQKFKLKNFFFLPQNH